MDFFDDLDMDPAILERPVVKPRPWWRALWLRLRFGTITSRVVGTAGDHVIAEVEYLGRGGKIIGYWAYGSFDPNFPYQGD